MNNSAARYLMNLNELPFSQVSVHDIASTLDSTGHMTTSTDLCGFFLCQQGTADVSINDHTFHIQRGDVYFYTPSTFLYVESHSNDLEGIAVKCDLNFVLPLMENVIDGRLIMLMREKPCVSLTDAQQKSTEQLITTLRMRQAMLSNIRSTKEESKVLSELVLSLAQAVFYELFYYYTSQNKLGSTQPDARDHVFHTFIFSLFKNYKREREVAFYADEQQLSPRYFSSIVKEKSGHSALHWIVLVVISAARQQLRNTNKTIKEIALDFNFPTQSFFGKYFKQYVGVGPKEYRLNERNIETGK